MRLTKSWASLGLSSVGSVVMTMVLLLGTCGRWLDFTALLSPKHQQQDDTGRVHNYQRNCRKKKCTLKMDFSSNNVIKSDQTRFEWNQTSEPEDVSIISTCRPPNSTAPRELWLHFMKIRNFPTSHDGPNWADEMENLGFDSWIISEAPDSLIDPPTDCRTTDRPNRRKRAV